MQEQQFVSAVKESLDLPDNRSAERAVKATLTVLGQRLEGGEAKDLASQLPGGLADALPNEGAGERFDVDTFYQRIAEQEGEGVTVAQARQHAHDRAPEAADEAPEQVLRRQGDAEALGELGKVLHRIVLRAAGGRPAGRRRAAW